MFRFADEEADAAAQRGLWAGLGFAFAKRRVICRTGAKAASPPVLLRANKLPATDYRSLRAMPTTEPHSLRGLFAFVQRPAHGH